MSQEKEFTKLTIVDRFDEVVRVFTKADNGKSCEERKITLLEMARGFCKKYPTRGYRIGEIDGGAKIDLREEKPEEAEVKEENVPENKEDIADESEDSGEEDEEVEVTEETLKEMDLKDLRELAKNIGISGYKTLARAKLTAKILETKGEEDEEVEE